VTIGDRFTDYPLIFCGGTVKGNALYRTMTFSVTLSDLIRSLR